MANDWRETVDEVLALQADPDMDTAPGPAIQWYPSQWSGDPAVQLMSMEARGIHHHLLMCAWRGFAFSGDPVPCSLPADPEMLRSLCQHPAGWDASWPAVARAWKEHSGRLWNLGLCREYLRQMQRRRSARKGAAVRWGSERTPNAPRWNANGSGTDANASESQCTSDSSLPPSSPPPEEEEETQGATPPLAADGELDPPKLNAQALRVKRLEDFHRQNGAKPPQPPILARWLKVLGGETEALAFLEDMANRGHLGDMEYCGKVATSWSNGAKPRVKRRRVEADPVSRARRDAEEAAFRAEHDIPEWP